MWNRRNVHYWSAENPHWAKETGHQYRWSLNVWAGIIDETIIGPVFIDGTLNSDKYLMLLNEHVVTFLNGLPVGRAEIWYQQDGAPAHSSVAVRNRLNEIFGNHWIGRFGPHRWPPRSPDLTPLDFYLWGAIKNDVYATPSETMEVMREKIIASFRKIRLASLRSVHRTILRRYATCMRREGRHVEISRRNRE